MTRKRSFRSHVVDSVGSEEDKMHVNKEEDVHEDKRSRRTVVYTNRRDHAAASVAAAESSRVTPSPVPTPKEAIVKKTPPLSTVWDSSFFSLPYSKAFMTDDDNDFEKLDASLRQYYFHATVPAKAALTREVDESIDQISVMLQQERSYYGSCYDYLSDLQDPASSENSSEHKIEGWRRTICEWSFEVVDHFGFDREVVSIALNYLDRVIADTTRKTGTPITRKEFQLAAVTTFYLAIKLHGELDSREGAPRKLGMNAFIKLGLFSLESIKAKERSILAALEWRVNPPTTVAFIGSLLRLLPETFKRLPAHGSVASSIFEMAKYLTELSVCVSSFSFQFTFSEIAYAAILCSIDALRDSVPFPYEVRMAFLNFIAGVTSLSLNKESVRRACTMLMEICPSIFDERPDDVLTRLSRSVSITQGSEDVTPEGGKKIPVCTCKVQVEEFIQCKRMRRNREDARVL